MSSPIDIKGWPNVTKETVALRRHSKGVFSSWGPLVPRLNIKKVREKIWLRLTQQQLSLFQ